MTVTDEVQRLVQTTYLALLQVILKATLLQSSQHVGYSVAFEL
jgi:hypothetical protein